MPSKMPRISTLEQDYKIGRYGTAASQVARNLDSFFYGGFVYNLDSQVPTWRGSGVRKGAFKKMLTKELERQYQTMTGKKVRIGRNLRNISRMVEPLRASSLTRSSLTRSNTATVRKPRSGLRRILGRIFRWRSPRPAHR